MPSKPPLITQPSPSGFSKVLLACILTVVLGASLGQGHAADAQTPSDWPSYRGPVASGWTGTGGHDLIEDVSQVKVLWESEDLELPGPNKNFDMVRMKEKMYPYGYAWPITHAGRIYHFHFIPGGSVRWTHRQMSGSKSKGITSQADIEKNSRVLRRNKEVWKAASLIEADDVVTCLDANNGRIIWQRRFAGEGLFHRLYSPQVLPCIGAGRIYSQGTAGHVRAFDLETGKLIWQSDIKTSARHLEQLRRLWKETKVITNCMAGSLHNNSPLYVDGVVVAHMNDRPLFTHGRNGAKKGHGMIGLDAATGRHLWTVPGCLFKWCSPVPWVHAGKSYVIASCRERLVAVDVKTGKPVWDYPAEGKGGWPATTMCVSGDYLISNIGHTDAAGGKFGPTCWKMCLDGITKLWSRPQQAGTGYIGSAVVLGDGRACVANELVEVATGKVLGKSAVHTLASHNTCTGIGELVHRQGIFYRVTDQGIKKIGPLKLKTQGLAQWSCMSFLDGVGFYKGTKNKLIALELRLNPPAAPPSLPAATGTAVERLSATYERDRLQAVTDCAAVAADQREATVPQVLALVESGNWPVCKAAAEALVAMKAEKELVAEGLRRMTVTAVRAGDHDLARLGAATVTSLDAEPALLITQLVKVLGENNDDKAAHAACRALIELPDIDKATVIAVAAQLKASGPLAPVTAARALDRWGAAAAQAASALATAMDSELEPLRYHATLALVSMGEAAGPYTDQIVARVLSDRDFMGRDQGPTSFVRTFDASYAYRKLATLGAGLVPAIGTRVDKLPKDAGVQFASFAAVLAASGAPLAEKGKVAASILKVIESDALVWRTARWLRKDFLLALDATEPEVAIAVLKVLKLVRADVFELATKYGPDAAFLYPSALALLKEERFAKNGGHAAVLAFLKAVGPKAKQSIPQLQSYQSACKDDTLKALAQETIDVLMAN